MTAATLFEKIWAEHVITTLPDGTDLLHIDRHILHDLTSAQAFDALRRDDRTVREPGLTIAVQDHIIATAPGRSDETYPPGAPFVRALRRNAKDFGIRLIDIDDARQGIVHVIAPELGFTLPGTTFVCGDSHTCTNGGLGALAFGLGTGDVAHVLATQTLALQRPGTFRIRFDGRLGKGVSAKDMALRVMAHVVDGATGFAVEYAGAAVTALPVEGRLTLCNMSIELGARIGMVAPDDTTFAYLADRPLAPKGALWDAAVAHWRTLPSAPDARFDREVTLDVGALTPVITWGTSPAHAIAIDGVIPDPARETDPARREAMVRALAYMGLTPGTRMEDQPVDQVFIGSCTNARISDLRQAADIARGRNVAPGLRAMVVPGSTAVKRQAEAEGLDQIFRTAGFEWHESACSMCASVNADMVPPRQRCVSTSNRNYEGRQGREARTHLASPATAAAAAVTGRVTDPRRLMEA